MNRVPIQRFFSERQETILVKNIQEAEKNTSGEIRVHIENTARMYVFERALEVFQELGIEETKQSTGVLLYIAIEDRQFAILGDKKINKSIPPDFWENTRQKMEQEFKQGRLLEGLCEGIKMVGEHLKLHFPAVKHDKNEFSNQVSREK